MAADCFVGGMRVSVPKTRLRFESDHVAAAALVHPSSMQSHTTPPTPDLPLLQGASQVVQDYFVKDSQVIPDIGELLVLRRSVQPRAQW
jgi:hypothetical protein